MDSHSSEAVMRLCVYEWLDGWMSFCGVFVFVTALVGR
jgi:hypothetical protein